MAITLTLAGDTMLGRLVADHLNAPHPRPLFSDDLHDLFTAADLRVLNLECCISDRGRPWPEPGKRFFFRAPPKAVKELTDLRVDCVTLANNHALDYGYDALTDTLGLLHDAGIATVGAGADQDRAWTPALLHASGLTLAVLGVADHPPDFAARHDRPGTAYADLRDGVPEHLTQRIARLKGECDAVLVLPHWGPNMCPDPLPHLRTAARALLDAGATVVAGTSAHVFQGVSAGPVLHDLGDFVDDYATHEILRNDLGLLWRVTLEEGGVSRIAAVPLVLEFCHTRLADGPDRAWIGDRLAAACAALGTTVREEGTFLVIEG